VTISFKVTGLVPSASKGISSSLLWCTPIACASVATLAGPTVCISWVVMVFL
jgi:hypothetical protein